MKWINRSWAGSLQVSSVDDMEENSKEQECIPVGCIPTAAVPATRCQYCGLVQTSFKADPPRGRTPQRHTLCGQNTFQRQTPFKGRFPFRDSSPFGGRSLPVDKHMLLKTLPSLAVHRNVKKCCLPLPCLISLLWSPQVLHNSQWQSIGGSVFDSFSTTSVNRQRMTEDLFRSLQDLCRISSDLSRLDIERAHLIEDPLSGNLPLVQSFPSLVCHFYLQ